MSFVSSPTTVHRGQDLDTIDEDSPNHVRTKSLELNTSGIDTHHFNDTSAGPKRRSTAPAGGERRHRHFFNFKGILPNWKPRRQSTSNTQNSVITNASASFEETAVWDQKVLLALDGGGIRGYSALLILKALMEEIGKLETNHSDEPARSSFHPLSPAPCIATDSESVKSHDLVEAPQTESSPWLPCHYFDYMAGTSTGG
ncbi:hypothetical protein MMC29_005963 [Sticta canariensis]|nr:hypothetical protein [Sticta canariensis]